MGKRIYIAGKISGLSQDVYTKNFAQAAEYLKEKGHVPINPVDTSHLELPYSIQMEVCKLLLASCDAIYMLSNWSDSAGAKQERHWAEVAGKLILYQEEEEI